MRPSLPALLLTASLAGAVPSAPVLAADDGQNVGEHLLLTPPAGWQPVQMQRSEKMTITRLYPPGENEKAWTEIVTVQIYPTNNQSARQFAESLIQFTREACDAIGPSPVTERAVNGYPLAAVSVTCSRGKSSGMGGFVMATVIRGKDAIYAVQRQWRGPAFGHNQSPAFPPDMLRRWSVFFPTISLCDTRDTRHPCP